MAAGGHLPALPPPSWVVLVTTCAPPGSPPCQGGRGQEGTPAQHRALGVGERGVSKQRGSFQRCQALATANLKNNNN